MVVMAVVAVGRYGLGPWWRSSRRWWRGKELAYFDHVARVVYSVDAWGVVCVVAAKGAAGVFEGHFAFWLVGEGCL